jgi:hypothetical protein
MQVMFGRRSLLRQRLPRLRPQAQRVLLPE